MNYSYINYKERVQIETYLKEGNSVPQIADKLGRHKTSIRREIRNNSDGGDYDADFADLKSSSVKSVTSKHYKSTPQFDLEFINTYDPKDSSVKTSYYKITSKNPNIPKVHWKTVYNRVNRGTWIFVRNELLRDEYVEGGKRGSRKNQNIVPNTNVHSIDDRAESVNNRENLNDFERDLIIGKNKNDSKLLILIDRKSRVTFSKRVYSKKAVEINSKLRELIIERGLNINTLTLDNGNEFSKVGEVAIEFGFHVYKAYPYNSGQRGSNENANGIYRRFFSKGTRFDDISDDEIFETENRINNMPRELFGWKSANEFHKLAQQK